MSKPINICGSSNKFDPFNTDYLYKLEIIFNDLSKKEFVKLTKKKFIKILTFDKDVKYDNIKSFYIVIENLSQNTTYSLSSNFEYNKDLNCNTFKNENIYLEFRKNNNLQTECNCYLNAFDNNRIFVTPPNY